MIIEWLLHQAVSALLGLFEGLPLYPLDLSEIGSAATTAGALASALNGYFPVATLGLCLGILVALKLALTLWHAVLFIYHQFWGSS